MYLSEKILTEIIAEKHIHDLIKDGSNKKGGTRKIADLPQEKICRNKEHNPPMHMVYEPGIYEHVCPACGERQIFIVPPKPTLWVNLNVT